jgi:hypothetical protein
MKSATNKNRYIVFNLICALSFFWLALKWKSLGQHNHNSFSICWFKFLTKLPCPSCGTSRSIYQLINGDFSKAFELNPIGYIGLSLLICIPFLSLIDFFLKSKYLIIASLKLDELLKKKIILFPFLTLIFINWIWNIAKNI